MSTIAHIMGLDSGSGYWYLFWSGIGSDLAEVAIVGGLVQVYRKHTCHVHRCWRLSRHPVAGTDYVTCRKHHPTLAGHTTAATIAAAAADRPVHS